MSNQTVAIRRLVTAETERFPKLASSFFTEAITATQQLLARYAEAQCRRSVTGATRRCLLWVKSRKAQHKHILSVIHLIADTIEVR